MRILITNDDGIFSPGIKALAQALAAVGEVFVVAPDVEQSAVGHGITVRRPLRFKHTASAGLDPIPAYRVDGTPADCVVLGVHLLGRPDLIASGINIGVNLGLDLTHSGTVAGALEGTSMGIPSIAFSMDVSGQEELDFSHAAREAVRVARWVLEHGLPPKTFLNVNFPIGRPKGFKATHLSTHRYEDSVIERLDPNGVPYYWIAGEPTGEEEPGSDLWAVKNGYVSITPVSLDYTDYAMKERLQNSLPAQDSR